MYTESTKIFTDFKKLQMIQTKSKTVFIHDKAYKQSVCTNLKCFAHHTHSSPLLSSEK